MPKIRFDSPSRTDDDDFNFDVPETSKWFDIFKSEPNEYEESPEHTATSIKIETQKLFVEEEKAYQMKINKAPRSSDEGWLRTVMQKGTTGDKVAALILSVQNSPVNNFNALSTLISMVKVSKKKQCLSVLDNLCELLVDELLPPGRKLRTWPQHPFKYLSTLNNSRNRSKFLCAWMFEAKLKEAYLELIAALESLAKDTVDAYREKAVSALYKLLSAHPEQEEMLLRNIVNKLGDPVQKVVSKVIYCLTQLLRIHPNMKLVVMHEVEKLLFRPNIGIRAQYYSICYLSQFVFSNEDQEVARYLIKIYFSFFKASIKKGDVDSRLMGALLMGVKRAYPFAKLDAASLNEHITTLYKLVHISPFNISLHTLCLLEQVSLQSEDRFYSALYKKLIDPKLVATSHQAMFINLMYKSLSKDENVPRVIAIIKRLFQVSLQMPVCFLCGILYMASQLMKNKKLLLIESTAMKITAFDDESSEDEQYFDADKTLDEEKQDIKENKVTGWNFVELASKSNKSKRTTYDWKARNPAYCNADSSAYFELIDLSNHFHPTVSLFASKILNGEVIIYSGDPLADFSLIRFLERFSFKNPKTNLNNESDIKGPDPKLAQRKYYKPSGVKAVNVNSSMYVNQEARFIPVDELFLYRYLKEKNQEGGLKKTKSKMDDDFDDADSVASEEFEELLDSMMGKKGTSLNFMEDVGDKLKNSRENQTNEDTESEDDEEVEQNEEESDDEEDVDGDVEVKDEEMDSEVDDIGTDDDEELSFDEGSGPDEDIDIDEFLNESNKKSKVKSAMKKLGLKKSGKKGSLEGLFAPAEEFSELLEETGSSKTKIGMAHSLANPENAAEKQINWEVKRDRWIRGANNRKRKFNKPGGKFKKKFKK